MMKKNKSYKNLLFFFLILICLYSFFTGFIYLNCFYASHQFNKNIDQEFLRIKIYGSSDSPDGNTVSGTFSIIDTNGNEIAVIERSWSGSYLAVDFAQIKINGKYFVFPNRVFGKNRIIEDKKERKKGTVLDKYYNDYGQCMLLGYGSTLKDRTSLYKISILANNKYHLINFGVNSTYTVDLSNCKTNTYYSIKYNHDGNISLSEI